MLLLLGTVMTLVVVRFDFSGIQSRQDVERMTTFLRARQAAAMRSGATRTTRIRSDPLTLTVSVPGTDGAHSLSLSDWRLVRPDEPTSFSLSPAGARGVSPLLLEHASGRRVRLVPDRMFVLRAEPPRGNGG